MHAKYKLKSRQRKSTDKRQNRLMLDAISKSKKAAKKVQLKPIAGVSQCGTKSGMIKGRGKAEIRQEIRLPMHARYKG